MEYGVGCEDIVSDGEGSFEKRRVGVGGGCPLGKRPMSGLTSIRIKERIIAFPRSGHKSENRLEHSSRVDKTK
ncbi:hypothetical protein F110043I8_16430 [Ruminococcus sp. f11]